MNNNKDNRVETDGCKDTVTVYKHHVKRHFDDDPTLYEQDNGPGEGATVFMSYRAMAEWMLSDAGRTEWVWCRAKVALEDIEEHGQGIATIHRAYPSIDGWRVFNGEEQ